MCEIPDELPSHDGPRCSYACWSTEPRRVSNGAAYNCKPTSRWARESHQVELVANLIISCSCDDDGLCKHMEHVITTDMRGCVQYRPMDDRERVRELKEYTRQRRRDLYSEITGVK